MGEGRGKMEEEGKDAEDGKDNVGFVRKGLYARTDCGAKGADGRND